MTVALSDLLTAQTESDIFKILLGVYQANGFPVTSWQPFGTERTRLMAIATAVADVSGNYIPAIAGGGFLDFASSGWLKLTAQELYSILYNPATFTQGNLVAANVAGAGAVSFASGQLIATFLSTGNRYFNVNSGTIAAGGGGGSTTSILFQAEFPGKSYADLDSQAVTLSTPIPGVTLTNPATFPPAVLHVGSGTGTLALTGTPTLPAYVIVRIDASGASDVAYWSYAVNGAPFVSAGQAVALANVGGTGITITLVGALTTDFVVNDEYSFGSPAHWITQVGSDEETSSPPGNNALATRCRNRWSTLSLIPTNSFYELIAQSTPGVGSQVTQVIVQQDSVINNQVNIVVAGPTGALPSGTITAIQDYITPRVPITDRPVVTSPSPLAIVLGGTITVQAALLAATTAAVETAWTDYLLAAGINGILRISKLVELAMDQVGAVDAIGLTINGNPANLTLGSLTTFQVADLSAGNAFTGVIWSTV